MPRVKQGALLRWTKCADITISRCGRYLIWHVKRGEYQLYRRAETGPHPFTYADEFPKENEAKDHAEENEKTRLRETSREAATPEA